MNCFSCFGSQKGRSKREHGSPSRQRFQPTVYENEKVAKAEDGNERKEVEEGNIETQSFTFRELATATKNFRQECLLGEGGSGRVYKGTLASTGQVVAVKQLDRNGLQCNKEFLGEVSRLGLLHHPNLVNLVGYCADGDQRLLVHELMSGGSLQDHLLDVAAERKPLNWFTRMKIALGAAKGLEYLHEKANRAVIYRDLKPSNILVDEDFTPKLSDFGLANLGPSGGKTPPSSRMMGTYGYAAPEYTRAGHLTQKSDVYSFGVILLELITGRRAIDTTKPIEEQNLVSWAQPKFKDPKTYPDMADPLLCNEFPEKDLNQVVAIAAMCLQEESSARPLMSDVVTALSFLSMVAHDMPHQSIPPNSKEKANRQDSHGGQGECEESEEYEDRENDDGGESEDKGSMKLKADNVSSGHHSSNSTTRGSRYGSSASSNCSSSPHSNASLSRKTSSKTSLHYSLSRKSSSSLGLEDGIGSSKSYKSNRSQNGSRISLSRDGSNISASSRSSSSKNSQKSTSARLDKLNSKGSDDSS